MENLKRFGLWLLGILGVVIAFIAMTRSTAASKPATPISTEVKDGAIKDAQADRAEYEKTNEQMKDVQADAKVKDAKIDALPDDATAVADEWNRQAAEYNDRSGKP